MIALPSLAVGGVFRMFRKSLVAQIVAGILSIWALHAFVESTGAKKERIRIGKENDKVVFQSKVVRTKSADPNVRGVRDPNAADN